MGRNCVGKCKNRCCSTRHLLCGGTFSLCFKNRSSVHNFCWFHSLFSFICVNLTFFPQHFLGLGGMPRRYYDFRTNFWFGHEMSRIGSYLSFFSLGFFSFFLLFSSIERKKERITRPNLVLGLETREVRPSQIHSHKEVIFFFQKNKNFFSQLLIINILNKPK